MIKRLLIILLGAILPLVITECTNPLHAGGSSDHGNAQTVAGIITDHTGSALAGVSVRLLPEGFNPLDDTLNPDTYSAITDAAGHFTIKGVPLGSYILTASDSSGLFTLRQEGIKIDSRPVTINPPPLLRPGAFKVFISEEQAMDSGYLFIPGTRFMKAWTKSSLLILDTLPAGRYSVLSVQYGYSPSSPGDTTGDSVYGPITDTLAANIEIHSGYTTDLTLSPRFDLIQADSISPAGSPVFFSRPSTSGFEKYPGVIDFRYSFGDGDTSWVTDTGTQIISHIFETQGTYAVTCQARFTQSEPLSEPPWLVSFYTGWAFPIVISVIPR